MKIITLFRYAFSIAGLTLLLAGCNSGGSSSGLPSGLAPSGPNSALDPLGLSPAGAAKQFHPHRLWVDPGVARRPRLLFVSDQSAQTVNIYRMPSLDVVGQVGGFPSVYGLCADRTGEIWVPERVSSTITKLSRTGQILDVLSDTAGGPYSCAVNPLNGDLAVTDYTSASGPGNVVIFPHEHAPGTVLSDPDMYYYYFAGYDDSGNLWINGQNDSGQGVIIVCSSSSCSTLSISGGTLYFPNFIQWVRGPKSWYVADNWCGGTPWNFCLYPISTSGVLGSPITLTDPSGRNVCRIGQAEITNAVTKSGGSRVLAGSITDQQCGGGNWVARWAFPAGGDPTHSTTDIIFPAGAAISLK